MGLLNALAGGIESAAETVKTVSMEQIKADIEEQKQQRLIEQRAIAEQGTHIANLKADTAEGDARRITASGNIERGATEIAAKRVTVPDDVEAFSDKAAQFVQSQTDDNSASRRSGLDTVNAYVKDNSILGGDVTEEDRRVSATKQGYIPAVEMDRNAREDKRNEIRDKHMDLQADLANRREDRLITFQEAQLQHLKESATIADKREARAATSKVMDSVKSDIMALEKEAANPMLAPEQKTVIDRQLRVLRAEGAQYRAALDSVGVKYDASGADKINTDEVRYDAQGNAYKRGADGKPTLVPKDAKAEPKAVLDQPAANQPKPRGLPADATVTQDDYAATETARSRREAEAEAKRKDRMKAQQKRGEEIDRWNARNKANG